MPVQLGQWSGSGAIGILSEMGFGLFLFGFLFEMIADWQLVRFKSKPENQGKVLDTGLWKYTRHPNHFGDAVAWWGLFLIASESGYVIVILFSLFLIEASNALGVIVPLLFIGGGGYLFWKLVRVLGRIQAPRLDAAG